MDEHRCDTPADGLPGAVWVCPVEGCHRHWWADSEVEDQTTPPTVTVRWREYTDADYDLYGRQS